MRQHCRIAAISLLALAAAACGDGGANTDAAATPAADDIATPAAVTNEAPAVEGTASPTPEATEATEAASPAPTASATHAAATEQPAAFAQCSVCHSVKPGENGIGPSLYGVVGRPSASEPGFNYSPAMKSANVVWDEATLNRYLTNPAKMVPGTMMTLPGIDEASRKAVIDYLKTL